MSYNELIKSADSIRSYLVNFYIYGFKKRNDFKMKSERSYDNERRRIESWLGDYIKSYRDSAGKISFISVDSRSIPDNPLQKIWKVKCFTDINIVLHFYILDTLSDGNEYSLKQLVDHVSASLEASPEYIDIDEATYRIKLKSMVDDGIVTSRKISRTIYYSISPSFAALDQWQTAVSFYSSAASVCSIGTYISDRFPNPEKNIFRFKHRYLANVLDDEICYKLLSAVSARKIVEIQTFSSSEKMFKVIPLKIYVGATTGRRYLAGYRISEDRFSMTRLDRISELKEAETAAEYGEKLSEFNEKSNYIWGVSLGDFNTTYHVEMDIFFDTNEQFILSRIKKECRCGNVEMLSENCCRFSADVFDANELIPWIRSFFGRIIRFSCTDSAVEVKIRKEINNMLMNYEVP